MARNKLKINPEKTALLLIDFQNDIVSKGGIIAPNNDDALLRFAQAIANAKRALEAARNSGILVHHVRHCNTDDAGNHVGNPHGKLVNFIHSSGALVPGKPGFEFVSELTPANVEAVTTKYTISAFAGTNLAETLNDACVDTVIIAGMVTHWAAEGAIRSAHDLGFHSIVLSDACSAGSIEIHEQSLGRMGFIATSLTTDDFLSAI